MKRAGSMKRRQGTDQVTSSIQGGRQVQAFFARQNRLQAIADEMLQRHRELGTLVM